MAQDADKQVQVAVLAVPCMDGKMCDGTAKSISDARLLCIGAGIWTELIVLGGCPYLPLARNKLIKQFLDNPRATDLVFIDADVSFPAEALVQLLLHDVDVVGGVYRYKGPEERYPVMPMAAEEGPPGVPGRPALHPTLPLIEAQFLPTGFMRIRRGVFERFRAHHGDIPLQCVRRDYDGVEIERWHNYMDTRQLGEQWFGEDVLFSRMWREAGGQLWIDPQMTLTHSGMQHFTGNYHDFLSRQPGGAREGEAPALQADGEFQRLRERVRAMPPARKAALRAKLGDPVPPLPDVALVPLGGAGGVGAAAPAIQGGHNGPALEAAGMGAPPFGGPRMMEGPELLLGAGVSRIKSMIRPGGTVDWNGLHTLDINPAHGVDTVFDLTERGRWPFDDDTFSEIHAYEVLEHCGAQGDWWLFFHQFAEMWRILKPGGWLIGSVPAWDSEFVFGDPSHSRCIATPMFSYLEQAQYRRQIGTTMMADFRWMGGEPFYTADWRIHFLQMDKENLRVCADGITIERVNPPNGRFTRFILQAVKPSTFQESDRALIAQNHARRQEELRHQQALWKQRAGVT